MEPLTTLFHQIFAAKGDSYQLHMFVRQRFKEAQVTRSGVVITVCASSSDFLQAFECPGFTTLALSLEYWPHGLDIWREALIRVLQDYPFELVLLSLHMDPLVKNPTEYRLYSNSLAMAVLSNKSVEQVMLSAKCSDADLETFTDQVEESSTFGPLRFPGHSNTKALLLWRWPLTDSDVEVLASESPSLKHLVLAGLHKSPKMSELLVKFLKVLETNSSLHHLEISNSPAVDVPEVYEALFQLLTSTLTLQNVELHCPFPLDERNTALRMRLDSLQAQKRKKQGVRWALRSFPRVKPTSIRIFFCGHPYAGKTTLRKTMVSVLQSSSGTNLLRHILPSRRGKEVARTLGIDVTRVNHNGLEISFWDLAGQEEYRAFHDVFMPSETGPSLFLLVCSLVTDQGAGTNSYGCKLKAHLSAELKYWLRYICSNTKLDQYSARKPSVMFIFTHLDKLEWHSQAAIVARGEDLKDEMQRDFEGVADVVAAFCVDACSINSVSMVVEIVLSEAKKICNSSGDLYSVCDGAKKLISEQIERHPDKAWVTKDSLKKDLMDYLHSNRHQLSRLQYKEDWEIVEAIIHDLHHTGNIIYFKDSDVVVLNLQWFCKDFMGGIIKETTQISQRLSNTQSHRGFWESEEIKAILKSILYGSDRGGKKGHRHSSPGAYQHGQESHHVQQLINIMKQLELCFECDEDGRNGLFVPATLNQNNQRSLRGWTANLLGETKGIGDFSFVGRRLVCQDEGHTFLTPGIFPRLQVHLRNVLQSTPYYRLERDLIKIVDDSMEVIIEFNELPVSFIDIMVRFPTTSKDQEDVLEFISKLICCVRELQRDSGCWRGVELIETALRASCLEKLIPPEYKGEEFVTLEKLRGKIQKYDAIGDCESITYTWGPVEAVGMKAECVSVMSLLGKRVFLGIMMEERVMKVEELSKCLGVKLEHTGSSSSSHSSNFDNSGRMYEVPLACFRRGNSLLTDKDAYMYGFGLQMEMLTQEMTSLRATVNDMARDTKKVVELLHEQKVRLLPEMWRILQELRNASSTEHSSDLPNFFIFEDKKSRRLICKLVPCVHKYRLRFMCESEPMPHMPENQKGMEVTTLQEGAVRSLFPYLQILLSALAVGLRVGAPMAQAHGLPVADLSTLINELVEESRRNIVSDQYVIQDVCPHEQHRVAAAKARMWVKGLMQQKGCDRADKMYDLFGLKKQQLADGRWLWLCDHHQSIALSGLPACTLFN